MVRGLIAPFALLAALTLTGCSDDATTSTPGAAPDSAAKTGGCREVKAPAAKAERGGKEPTDLDAAKTNTVTFSTSCGDFTVTLDPKSTAASSVAALARSGFYDKTSFHRIVPGFVIQGGDPTGTGSGGPGYSTTDEMDPDTTYTAGVVAMAKTGAEPPGTAGSQFFVVTAADAGLPPDYAVIGKVTDGMDTVKRIEALGTASEQPSRPVVVDKATFRSK